MPKIKNFRQPDFPQLEEEVLEYWKDTDAFKESVAMRPEDTTYVFYDGPPFATGMPHYGHLLASTTKDVIPRYWTMKGYRVNRVWGWDCHGLPIENMIEKQLDIKGGKKGIEALGIDQFNAACRAEVLRLDKEWEYVIDRLGRWVDMENNYKTMDTSFMESVWWGFKQLADKDLIYEGKRVILYCPRCSTPLSNFEIAMDNSYVEVTEPSNTYKYKLKDEANTYLLAWSTTPWNKLATPALAVNPDLQYVKVRQGDEFYILAHSRLEQVLDDSKEYEAVERYTGRDLEKFEFELHYDFYPERKKDEKAGVIIADDFVTADEGTGVVTLAIYGEDDFRVMKEHQIQLVEHVDDEGKLKPEVGEWAGLSLEEVNPLVNNDLSARGLMYKEESHTHNVATCYRCATRLYYAPLPAWFVDVQALKEALIKQNENINWVPDHLKHGRFLKGLETAPDWNISRSRYWGTPMPIWVGTDEAGTRIRRIIGSIDELREWAVDAKEVASITDIHREHIDHIKVWVDDAKTVVGERIPEVFDCWVESGSMPFASVHYPFENKEFFEDNYPAQFVSEYIAQTRAWFYTMHVLSVGIFGKPPFENVLTTGTILAEDGTKMSKSKKNYPDPMELINNYGVDSLRLYLMSSTVMKSENLNFNEQDVADIRRRVFVIWWNMLSFYMQFANHQAGVSRPANVPEHIMDKWLMSRIDQVTADVTGYMDAYDVVRASRTIMDFVQELSTWYLRLSRDRIRDDESGAVGQVFGYTLYTLAQLAAPFAPFFTELVHHTMRDDQSSIHHSDWPMEAISHSFAHDGLEAEMGTIQKIVEQGHAARSDKQVKVRQPLAKVTVTVAPLTYADDLTELLQNELNVKDVVWKKGKSAEPSVEMDFSLTPELKDEGEARELARTIQNLRKKARLRRDQTVTVKVPSWPASWKSYIQDKTNSTLVKGSEIALVDDSN